MKTSSILDRLFFKKYDDQMSISASDEEKLRKMLDRVDENERIIKRVLTEIREQEDADDWEYKHRRVDDNGKPYPSYDHQQTADLLTRLIQGGHE